MANTTRDQFDVEKGVQKKIFQKGILLMDADLNEQIDITLERHRRALSCLLGGTDTGFDNPLWTNGSGFKITSHSSALTVSVVPGDAAFHLDENHAALVTHEALTELTGFQSWVSGGLRTDLIYIDIEEKEISPEDDPNIVNPATGAETCRDIRLQYEIKIEPNVFPPGYNLPTAPSGHVYRRLALVSKDGSNNQIVMDDITMLLPNLSAAVALESMEVPLWMEASVSHGSFDAQALENDDFAFKVDEENAGSKTNIVIKVPYVYDPAHNYLALHCQAMRAHNTNAWVRLEGLGTTGFQAWIQLGGQSSTLEDVAAYLQIPSGLTEGQVYELQVVLYGSSTIWTYVRMYRPVISAGLGQFRWGQGGV